jgi:2C-methyl-D-erythritol 2,4-cyclodiphosphate synthase
MPRIFAVALLIASRLFAGDCTDCAPTKICPAHTTEDDAAIAAAASQLKDADPQKRIAGVDALAAAAEKHLNARSKKITAELARMLADPWGGVKERAGEKLGLVGEPVASAQALTAEIGRQEKVAGGNRPKKPEEEKKWEAALSLTKTMYAALAETKAPSAVATFDKAFGGSSPLIARHAADSCLKLKGQKGLLQALMDGMHKWVGTSQAEGVTDAFFSMAGAMEAVVDDEKKPKRANGKVAPVLMGEWDKWWKENEKKVK